MKKIIILASLLLLSACTTPTQREKMQKNIEQADHVECLKLGFIDKSEKYGDCRLRLKEMRIKERSLNNTVIQPSFGFGWGSGRYRY